MKKLLLFVPAFFVCLVFVSCLNTSKNDKTVYYEAMVNVTSNGTKPTFMTDNGTTLESSIAITSDTGTIFHNGDRVFITFSFDDTTSNTAKIYPVTVTSYALVKIKNLASVNQDSADSYYNQMLYSLYKAWISKDYFNLEVRTYMTDDNINTCDLLRIKDKDDNSNTSCPSLYFELRHNVKSIYSNYNNLGFYSFDIASLKNEFPNADSIKIKLNWYDAVNGTDSYDFVYKPSNTSRSIPVINRQKDINIFKWNQTPF